MNLDNLHSVYCIGIGGIGMSALALYFKQKGAEVSGFDRTKTKLTKQLESYGITIHYSENEGQIPENPDLVIYTPAIKESNIELSFCRKKGFNLKKRSEILGLLSEQNKTIAIAGTHGKTSISALTAFLGANSRNNVTSFVGGIMKNFNSNLIVSKNEEFIVMEADEFDRSFLKIKPQIALITSTDSDHLDIYEDDQQILEAYQDFANNLADTGVLIIKKGLPISRRPGLKVLTYSADEIADYYCSQTTISKGNFFASIHYPGNTIKNIQIPIAGKHNLENTIAAIALANQMGLDSREIKNSLLVYKGVKRRFERVFENEKCTYIDDYAHHPKELEVSIKAARALFPTKQLVGIFQPHLYSRTRDYLEAFGESLGLLDEVMLLDIYPAREEPIPGINSKLLLDKISIPNKKLVTKNSILTKIEKNNFEVIITLGAGDIDTLVEPILSILKRKYNDV